MGFGFEFRFESVGLVVSGSFLPLGDGGLLDGCGCNAVVGLDSEVFCGVGCCWVVGWLGDGGVMVGLVLTVVGGLPFGCS